MKKTILAGALAAPLLMFALNVPAYADSMCKDGSTSTATGKGACSGHGGVQKAAKAGKTAAARAPAAAAAAPAPAPATAPAAAAAKPAAAPAAKEASAAPAGNTDATGAAAKCKDGTYSKSKSHKGACSHHGGVAEWLAK